jgi:hypothetical protein
MITTKPPNHQTTKPPNHQTTKPPNHQTTKPPNHQTTKPAFRSTRLLGVTGFGNRCFVRLCSCLGPFGHAARGRFGPLYGLAAVFYVVQQFSNSPADQLTS